MVRFGKLALPNPAQVAAFWAQAALVGRCSQRDDRRDRQ